MVTINREEAMAIRKQFGDDSHISITNRQKLNGRKRYYLPEEEHLLRFLREYRERQTILEAHG